VIIDTSAIVAILFKEPEAHALALALSNEHPRLLPAPTLAEAAIVLYAKAGDVGRRDLDRLIRRAHITVIPFEERHAELAGDAFERFGKGQHRARLNFGDCIVYGIAKDVGEPILCVGNDFAQTDALLFPI
jgi:ribonuclease VapC